MKKYPLLLVLAFSLIWGMQSKAQYYFWNDEVYDADVIYEFGPSINAMNCLTDLGGKAGVGKKFIKDLNFGKTHFSAGLFGNVIYQNKIAFRLEGTYGQVSGYDDVLVGITDLAHTRFNRNLTFKSTIMEVSGMVEMHPMLIFINWLSKDVSPPRYSPYLVGGIGYFKFNPQGKKNNGSWVDLQPLSTEGQGFDEYPDRKPYKLSQINFPLGAGVRYELGPRSNLRIEFVYRMLKTDYLDDVSTTYIDPNLYFKYFTGRKLADALEMNDRQLTQVTAPLGGSKRGNPDRDAYMSVNLKYSIIIGRETIR